MSNFFKSKDKDTAKNKPEDIRKVLEKVEPVDSVDIDEMHTKLNEISEEKAGMPCCQDDDDEDDEDDDVEDDDDVEEGTNNVKIVDSGKFRDLKDRKRVKSKSSFNVLQKPTPAEADNEKYPKEDIPNLATNRDASKNKGKEGKKLEHVVDIDGIHSSLVAVPDEAKQKKSEGEGRSGFLPNLVHVLQKPSKTESVESNPYLKNDNITAFFD